MGTEPGLDCRRLGELVGIKTFTNEFIAYEALRELLKNREVWKKLLPDLRCHQPFQRGLRRSGREPNAVEHGPEEGIPQCKWEMLGLLDTRYTMVECVCVHTPEKVRERKKERDREMGRGRRPWGGVCVCVGGGGGGGGQTRTDRQTERTTDVRATRFRRSNTRVNFWGKYHTSKLLKCKLRHFPIVLCSSITVWGQEALQSWQQFPSLNPGHALHWYAGVREFHSPAISAMEFCVYVIDVLAVSDTELCLHLFKGGTVLARTVRESRFGLAVRR